MDYRKQYGSSSASFGSLCDSCAHGHVVKGHAESERLTICRNVYPRFVVPFAVRECSAHVDRTLPEVEDLELIAIDLTREKLRRAGFESPERKLQRGFAPGSEPATEVV
jgi:hypothetical protein